MVPWHGNRDNRGNRGHWRSIMICVAVTYVIQPGHEDEAVALFAKLTEHTRTEPGCRMYLAHRSTTDARRFFLYEQYDDQACTRRPSRHAPFRAVCQGGPVPDHRKPHPRDLRSADRLKPRISSATGLDSDDRADAGRGRDGLRDQEEEQRCEPPYRNKSPFQPKRSIRRGRRGALSGEHLRVSPRPMGFNRAGEARSTAMSSG